MPPTTSSSGRVPPPPRDLNVQAFAESRGPELESLHAIVAARTNRQFLMSRGKRRRTTSFDDRIARKKKGKRGEKRQRVEGESGVDGYAGKEGKERLNRRLRRRIEFRENPESGYVLSADGTRRLRTHLWHTKRFTMVKRWGFFLPLGLHGKGRGSRAVLRRLKTGTLVHDSSYCCPIELEGPEDSVLAILEMVMVPPPTNLQDELLRSIICGACYGSAMLHYIGAPDSQFVAPVMYMWRASLKDHGNVEVETNCVSDGCATSRSNNENNILSRQIWIWLHAAAFNEGFDVLRSACLKQKNETGVNVSCVSLEGQLAKFEIMGQKSVETLQKILHSAFETCCSTEPFLRRCTSLRSCTNGNLKQPSIVASIRHAPSHAILSLEARDPRDLHAEETRGSTEAHPTMPDEEKMTEDPGHADLAVNHDVNTNKEPSLLCMEPESSSYLPPDSKLWALRNKINPPKDERILCLEKHTRRLKHFLMDDVSAGKRCINEEGSTTGSCPVLLAKHDDFGLSTWWSIILPLKWAKAFWIPIVSSGANAIGLRERRWIASDNGLPSFPFDFPDCKAYSVSMASEIPAANYAVEHRHCSVRSSKIPIPSPWDCLMSSVRKGSQILEDIHTENDLSDDGGIASVSGESGVDSGCHSSQPPGQNNVFSTCFVIRALNTYHHLEKTSDGFPLLFHEDRGRISSGDLMGENILNLISKKGSTGQRNGRLCLLRVLLRSFKEGSFEDGAIIFAPTFSDILLWTSRPIERVKLQIPQRYSYFVERNPGKWELEVPKDPSLCESFRWPIGFVTTGFVHGSSKPVGEAFCEANMLSCLRDHQRDKMEDKARSEIFVLVRNLRSTAYRLALATVVLDCQKEDLIFM